MNNLSELEILVIKWQKTGLLEGLSVWHQIKLAQLLDNGAKILVERSKTNLHNEVLAGLSLPAISRKFRNLGTDFSVEELISQMETKIPELENQLNRLKEMFPTRWQKYENELESEFLDQLFQS